jgi:hypothetical protein
MAKTQIIYAKRRFEYVFIAEVTRIPKDGTKGGYSTRIVLCLTLEPLLKLFARFLYQKILSLILQWAPI